MWNKETSFANEVTQRVAAEMELRPADPVYRAFHPVLICGVENDQLLLRGNRTNGTLVVDYYESPGAERKVRASDLPEPGLNFTREALPFYKNAERRTIVSLRTKDQPPGLQIYPDVGSEVRSVYLTLPKDQLFRVELVEGDAVEIELALRLHEVMKHLNIEEEPYFYDWLGAGEGCQVITYVPQNQDVRPVTSLFFREGNSYRLETSLTEEYQADFEYLAVLRLLMEDRSFDRVFGADGRVYRCQDMLADL